MPLFGLLSIELDIYTQEAHNLLKYVIYKTTNLVDGKVYIGCHKTEDPNDDYLGSGTLLRRAIKKHGVANFRKEILHIFDSAEEMFDKEVELVNEDFVSRRDTYNIKNGGHGGWDHIEHDYTSEEYRMKVSKRTKLALSSEKVRRKISKDVSSRFINPSYRKKISDILAEHRYSFKGRHHSTEAKKRIGKANSKHQSGNGNSQYGTCWIYSTEEKRSMKISKDDLQEWIDRGWSKGRKMKF